MSTPTFPGTTIEAGGLRLVVPRLSIRQMQILKEQIKRLHAARKDLDVEAQIKDILDVVHAAVGRNHDDITRDHLGDVIDLGNVAAFLQAVLKGPDAVPAPGEAPSPEPH